MECAREGKLTAEYQEIMIHMKNQPTPLVSVIIPTYNSATTLEACLKSINEHHVLYFLEDRKQMLTN